MLSGGVAMFLLWSRRLHADQGACSALGELSEGGSAALAVRDGLQVGFMTRWFVTLSSPYFRCQFALSS